MPDATIHQSIRAMRADLMEYMRDRFDQVDVRLDKLNGTVRFHDTKLVELEVRCAERCDVGNPTKRTWRINNGRTWQVGGVGAALASIAWVVFDFIKSWGK